ncbi:MAG: DNA polymerase III [Nitrospinae bacterium RIFCSPLOWO2_02_FULL_39_110]|nr:MAG: DNA polymerase III [Nitrospinae bacterium RIFCSPHIGHO2_12_FULL_39_42]OGV99385.1 MAG: DNA polymerase III [Nitrospinae bacterium RIFCSPHIGHO2_02_39_11]OGW02961.1 MAG: DNA polymerase III [Nitrospinae bacterium RIFCSPHIGHO2_02_FULL_39_82]OGW05361.1 MAG: DNA polymerase III [Nitrospinae bacterium RIFCSPLOWO2_02_FULL_39_110]OGW06611.1 MAG: DNA polymerase III [Nitrospinae bacterium RIFCSPLOWO2_02_39_17]OGW10613.1 MAG: DNA polymerase III [Nitrospinae bacterium RIFCSPLOWO2_12_FULL_39_93]OGW1079
MKNLEIAQMFERIADILEFKGENRFKINAYRKASRVIGSLSEDIEHLHKENRLMDIPGVGSGIAEKITEYLDTGKMSKYEEAIKGVEMGLIKLMDIPGLGPSTLKMVYKELGIKDVEGLEKAASEGRLRVLKGMGEKKEENILRGIRLFKESQQRISIGKALPIVKEIINSLKKKTGVKEIEPAGSLRRMKETIGDIDILASGSNRKEIISAFVSLPIVKDVLASGETKGSIIVEGNIQVDLRVVEKDSFGAALQYFTGSKLHNIHLREMAKRLGLKISEYGIFRGDKKIGGEKEEDIYSAIGLDWIPSELREDRGEIEAAGKKSLPNLVKVEDIKGDFHVHSNWSDGAESVEEIVEMARKLGYQYIAITDHSKSTKIANGLTEERLLRQIKEIRELNEKLKGIKVLAGSEVDIKTDGTLDFPEKLLKELDIVVAAIHIGFKEDEETITNRVVSAMENPYVNIIAHPTGRLISSREPYKLNIKKMFEVSVETGTAIEINAFYDRLDLNDVHCKMAKGMGVKMAIGTDAHHGSQLQMMEYGLGVARRGWLEKRDLINTMSYKELMEWLNRR